VLDAGLVSFDSNSEMVFQKSYQFERADRIENPSRDELGFFLELIRCFTRQKLMQNEIVNQRLNLVHDDPPEALPQVDSNLLVKPRHPRLSLIREQLVSLNLRPFVRYLVKNC
jgi:hypothetical protein